MAGMCDVTKRHRRVRTGTWWLWLVAAIWVVALYLNFIYTSDAKYLLFSERIFYVHMGSATAVTFAYGITFVASIGYLWRRRLRGTAGRRRRRRCGRC